MSKFTFKINKSTGQYRSFYPDNVDIKLNKKLVGHIGTKNLSGPWQVSLAIKKEKTNGDPADFKWIYLKKEYSSINEAKEMLIRNTEAIIQKFDLYEFD